MDGTLVKTRAASWEVFRATAEQFALPVHSAEEFFTLFEGNFFESLAGICPDQQTVDDVRQHFMTGLKERYEPDFVPGMVDVIKSLAPHYALAVMSSNSMAAIRRILQNAGVAQCFAHVFSAEVGTSKRDHLRRVLDDPAYGGVRQCSPDYLEGHPVNDSERNQGAEVAIVTDTVGDVTEAAECGVRAIGVAWGMHGADALLAAGAERVVYWPQEITALLLPHGDQPTRTCACSTPGACTLSTSGVRRTPAQAGVSTTVEADVAGTAARLGRQRHARRTLATAGRSMGSVTGVHRSPSDAPSVGACGCGRGCGVTDAVHTCGPVDGHAGRQIVARTPAAGLAAAIARIAPRPP